MSEKKYPVKRKEELELSIEKVAFGGQGIGRLDQYVVFVKDTLPGDKVIARVMKRKTNYAEARLVQILEPSPLRRDAPCPYFDYCGGCAWQNLEYTQQIDFKKQHVAESLKHIGLQQDYQVLDTLPSGKIWGYRNKMEFSFTDRRWLLPEELGNEEIDRSMALGLHVPGTFDRILQVDNCLLQSETANRVLQTVWRFCKENELEPYGIRSHEGLMRFLVLRESTQTKKLMVNIVTSREAKEELLPLAEQLVREIPEVGSVINNINSRKAQIAFGERELVLAGEDHITENLFDLHFKISANSFFQTNTLQAENLYRVALEYAGLNGGEVVWDLYSGTGTISLCLAQQAKEVVAFEIVESAVADAHKNAADNKVTNVRFVAGDLLHNLAEAESVPDVIVVDPPRSGMHPKVCEFLAQSGAKRIVYVSCNPTTMARDIQLMSESYRLVKAQPVDMFPHTYHIETVSLLEKI